MPQKPTDDEIEQALRQAAQQGLPTEVDFDHLPAPELGTEDEIQSSLKQAKQREVNFDDLPAPSLKPPSPPPTRPMPTTEAKAPLPQPAKPKEPSRTITKISKTEPPSPSFMTDFWLILPLFLVFRLLTLFLLRPGGFIRDWSDFDTYFGIAALSDYQHYPFLHFWLEWPPILPWLAVGAYQLALQLPPWPEDPRLGFILILGSVFLLFEIGNFWLLHRLSQRLWPNPVIAQRVLWLYLALFPPVYAMLGFFDGIALFFILFALDRLLHNQQALSAISVGVGFMVKILPLVVLPIVAWRLWHHDRQKRGEAIIEISIYSIITGLTIIFLLSPFLINGSQWVETSARAMLGRSSWETVWAVMEGYYGFGVVEGNRLNPAETRFAVHAGGLPWWLITLLFAGWYGLIFNTSTPTPNPRRLIAFAGLTISLMLLYNKGYSPQFIVYILPFIVLLFPNGRGLVYSLILTGLNVFEQPIYFVLIPSATWLLTFIVLTRFVILLLLAAEFWLIIWPQPRWQPLHQRLPLILASVSALTLLLLTPLTLQAYTTHQRLNGPAAVLVNFMRAQAQPTPPRLIVTNQNTYRQIYPHVHDVVDVRLLGGPYSTPLSNALRDVSTVWLLPTGESAGNIQQQLAQQGRLLTTYNFESIGQVSLYSLNRQALLPQIPPARFTSGIDLIAYDIVWHWNEAEILLFWQANTPQATSYKVFTQLIAPNGMLLASHDGIPRDGTAPTTAWPQNIIIMDRHVIPLSPSQSTDGLIVITGLYNNVGERLPATSPTGQLYADRAVPLTP